MTDGTIHPRVSISIVDEFDDGWSIPGWEALPQRAPAIAVHDIASIEASPFALSATLATKAMYFEEWRMGAYRHTLVLHSGREVTVTGGDAVWLPEGFTSDDVADVTECEADPDSASCSAERPLHVSVSTPQTTERDRKRYEEHFASFDSGPIADRRDLLRRAQAYSERFMLRERPLAWAAARDALTTGVSRYERFLGDEIELLARFAAREGHCSVPRGHIEEGRELTVSGLTMLWKTGRLSPEDQARLEAIPGWETAAAEAASRILNLPLLDAARDAKMKRLHRIAEARKRALEQTTEDDG